MESTILLSALLRTTLFLTVSGLVCSLALRRYGDSMPRLSRLLWLAVLLTGWLWIRPVVSIPWKEIVQEPASVAVMEIEPEREPMPVFYRQPENFPETAAYSETIPMTVEEPVIVREPVRWKPLIYKTVFAVWIGGMVVSIFLSAAGYVRFLASLGKAVPAGDDFADPWRRLLEEHGIESRSVPMLVSEGRDNLGPALIRTVHGYRLVVPRDLWSELSEAGRCGILKHELAHFRRRDVWKSFLARVLALPHWFNPMSHLAVHRFEEAAELLCDRAAFDVHREGVLEFAKTLLLLHENAPTQFVARQSIFGRGLKRRVACLLHENYDQKVSTMKKIALLTGAVLFLTVCLLRVEFVEVIVAQTNKNASDTQNTKQTVRIDGGGTLVYEKGQWKNKESGETIEPGTLVEGTRGTFRLDSDGERGTVVRLSGDGAIGTGKYVELSDGGNAISVSSLTKEEMKNVIPMDEKDVFVFEGGIWKNEKTKKTIEVGAVVAGTRGVFRLEKKDEIGNIVLISGAGAIGSGKYIRWSNGGDGIATNKTGKPRESGAKKYVWSTVVEAETKKPFAGVKATLYFAKDGKVETRTTQTDAQGRILFPLPSELNADMEAGMNIRVEKDGYVSERDGRQAKWSERFLKEGKEICKTFPLQKAETITGRLLGPDGKPLSGITIAVLRQLVKPYGHEGRMRTEEFDLASDSMGKFIINAAKDEKIVFWAVPGDLAPAYVFPDKKRGDLGDIRVEEGIRPQVKVLDKDGNPVPDVWINISRRDGDENFGMNHMPQSVRSALTDKEGIARFRPILEGKYEVRINERPWEKNYNPNSIERSITWRNDQENEKKPVKGVFTFSTVDFSKSNSSTTLQARSTLQVDIRFSDKTAVSERDYNAMVSGKEEDGSRYYSRPTSDSPSGYKGDGLFSYPVPVGLKEATFQLSSSTDHAYRVRLKGASEWIEPENGYVYPLGPIEKDMEIDVTVYKSPKITLNVVDQSGKPVKEYYAWAEYADTKTPASVKFDGDKIRVDVSKERWNEINWDFASSELPLVGILDVHFKYKNFGKNEERINCQGILPDRDLRLYLVGKGYEIESQLTPGMKEGEEKTLSFTLKKSP